MNQELMTPEAYFHWEINQILNGDIKNLVSRIFREKVPQYFMQVDSAPRGDYHINFDNSHTKLCDHTKSAVREFLTMLNHPWVSSQFNYLQADYIIAALLLHDCMKRGIQSVPTTSNLFESPLLCVYLRPDNLSPVDQGHFNEIVRLIICQKGPWSTSQHSTTVLQEPYDEMTRMVHWCDWRASRRNTSVSISDDPWLLDYIARKR